MDNTQNTRIYTGSGKRPTSNARCLQWGCLQACAGVVSLCVVSHIWKESLSPIFLKGPSSPFICLRGRVTLTGRGVSHPRDWHLVGEVGSATCVLAMVFVGLACSITLWRRALGDRSAKVPNIAPVLSANSVVGHGADMVIERAALICGDLPGGLHVLVSAPTIGLVVGCNAQILSF